METKSKNQRKRVKLYLITLASCIVLAGVLAVLAIPDTALAAKKKENPGGNVKQQDISTQVTFDLGSLEGVEGAYVDGESNVDCKTGRRRTIWVKFRKNSSRSMTLNLGAELVHDEADSNHQKVDWETLVGELPNGPIDQVSLSIAVGENVSGLGEEFVDNVLYCDENGDEVVPDPADDPANFTCMLTNMRIDFRDAAGFNWRLFFGPGPHEGRTWPGGALITNPDPFKNAYVKVERMNPSHTGAGRIWEVDTVPVNRVESGVVPGFLHFKGTKPNDPSSYVGAFDVPWSCVAESLE